LPKGKGPTKRQDMRNKNTYLERYAYPKQLITSPPSKKLGLVVAIPCYYEPDLINSLTSLYNCKKPECDVEVIVVINDSKNCPVAVKNHNEACLHTAAKWAEENNRDWMRFHILYEPGLPQKNAGVGLARKIGMDEAIRRLEATHIELDNGIIACFDADSTCDDNYLTALERFMIEHPSLPGCSIYYEHPTSGSLPKSIYSAAIEYELYLRYYELALKYSNFPFAFQTIGSSMAVRAKIYQQEGGMNKRKAGEDFYFLQKLMVLGPYAELTTTRISPSPRISDRVPFGTGKAINTWQQTRQQLTYNPKIFEDLKVFIDSVDLLFGIESTELTGFYSQMPQSICKFLQSQNFEDAVAEANAQSKAQKTFINRFYRWFNGFRLLKYVHHARDCYFNNLPIFDAATILCEKFGDMPLSDNTAGLLSIYREKCKSMNAKHAINLKKRHV